jgi:hypothetical protein
LSAEFTTNNCVGAGMLAADAASGVFFAWCFAANAADVDRLRIAMLTMTVLFMLEISLGKGSAAASHRQYFRPPPSNIIGLAAFLNFYLAGV